MKARLSLPSGARSRRFQKALGKRLDVLDRDLPAVLEHDAEALHRTRVASRRLREVLPVLEAPAGGDAALLRKRRARVRRLTRALGGVRELDVALGLLEEVARGDDTLAPTVAAVRAEIERERAVRYAGMIESLADIKPRRLARELAAVAAAPDGPTGAEQRRRLRARLTRRARRLEAAVDAAGSLYAFDRLHEVRIAAKKLRYVLELVQELTGAGTVRLVTRLKRTQGVLGRLHDFEVLAAYVRRAGAPEGAHLADGAARLLASIEREARELHAEYLGSVPAIQSATAACLGGQVLA